MRRLTDNQTGEYERFETPSSPGDLPSRQGGNIVRRSRRPVFEAPCHEDRPTRKRVRPYQEMAVFETLYRFSQSRKRVLLLMATGAGKTFTVFQLVWKLFAGHVLSRNRILFLTDRNSLEDQAYRAFSAFDAGDIGDLGIPARGDFEKSRKGSRIAGRCLGLDFLNEAGFRIRSKVIPGDRPWWPPRAGCRRAGPVPGRS